MPAVGAVEHLDRVADRGVDCCSQGKSHPGCAAGGRKPVGGTGRVGPDQHLGGVRIVRVGAVVRRQRRQRLLKHADVIGGGIASGVALAQQPGQCLPGGDVGAVQKHQQRVEPERLFPGRRRPRGPGCRARMGTRRPDHRQVGGVDALINAPPRPWSRKATGPKACSRSPHSSPDSSTHEPTDSCRCRQMPRRPATTARSGRQARAPSPPRRAVRRPAGRRYFYPRNCCATVHLEGASPPE